MPKIDRRTLLATTAASAALLVLPGASARAEDEQEDEPTYVYVASNSFRVHNPVGMTVFRLDRETGALTPVQQVVSDFPSWITIDPSKRFLYACFSLPGTTTLRVGKVEAYAIDPRNGTLAFLNRVSLGDDGPAQLTVSPDGRHVVVANYYYGQFTVLPVGRDGSLGPISGQVQDTGSGPNPRQDSAHPHAVVFDPSGRFLATADLGNDEVQIFRLVDGGLELVSAASVTPGMGARHIAFSRDGETLYVLGELNGNITAFAYDSMTGTLGAPFQTVSTQPASYSGTPSGAEIAVHPSGRFLYASNRGSQTVAGYRIDRRTGELSLIGFATQGINGPTNFAIDPSGTWLYVNNSAGDNIAQFAIDGGTGELTPTGVTTPLFAATVMAFRTAD